MPAFRSWTALAIAFGLAAPAARAAMITPESIPDPPGTVSSGYGTPVNANNLVTTQYAGLGLSFSSGAAITNLNGVHVWAPIAAPRPGEVSVGQISYYSTLSGQFVAPGSLNPTTVTSFTLTIVGQPMKFNTA
jgi:hypothetical protein